jgi:hypothetical protein
MLENVRGVIDYSLLLVLFSIFLSAQKLQTLDTQDKCKKVQAECSQTRSLHTHTQRNVCKYSGYTSAMNIRSILPSETEFAGQRTLSRTTLSGLILATWTHPTAQYYTWTFMRIHSPLSQICVLFSIFFFSYSHQTRFDLFIRIHFLFRAIKVNNNIPAINISSSLPGTQWPCGYICFDMKEHHRWQRSFSVIQIQMTTRPLAPLQCCLRDVNYSKYITRNRHV